MDETIAIAALVVICAIAAAALFADTPVERRERSCRDTCGKSGVMQTTSDDCLCVAPCK